MWAEEVVKSKPERYIVVGTFVIIVSAADVVGDLKSTVQSFHHLLEWSEFSGYFIFICEADNLRDIELEAITEFTEELLGCKWIGAVAVSNN